MIPAYWKQATEELAVCDEVMHKLIQRYEGATLRSHGDAFTTLARSIVETSGVVGSVGGAGWARAIVRSRTIARIQKGFIAWALV